MPLWLSPGPAQWLHHPPDDRQLGAQRAFWPPPVSLVPAHDPVRVEANSAPGASPFSRRLAAGPPARLPTARLPSNGPRGTTNQLAALHHNVAQGPGPTDPNPCSRLTPTSLALCRRGRASTREQAVVVFSACSRLRPVQVRKCTGPETARRTDSRLCRYTGAPPASPELVHFPFHGRDRQRQSARTGSPGEREWAAVKDSGGGQAKTAALKLAACQPTPPRGGRQTEFGTPPRPWTRSRCHGRARTSMDGGADGGRVGGSLPA